jgi:hypothetical protein
VAIVTRSPTPSTPSGASAENTGFGAISYDLTFLLIFSVVSVTFTNKLFKRSL